VLRVRNVVAVAVGVRDGLSPRVRAALKRLR
jgi:hypothetical protein